MQISRSPLVLVAAALALAVPPAAGPAAAQQPDAIRPDTGLAAIQTARAEPDAFDFYDRGPYREDVPRPRDFLGYPAGSLHTPHHRAVAYLRALEEAAPGRIQVERYGSTYEGRPLVLAFIGSEENVEGRSEIRRAVQRLAEPRGVTPEAARRLAAENPPVVWLDYGNDGNESANLEAALHVAYQLVAGESERTRRLRDGALVILNPDHNPESHDRHAVWQDAFAVGATDDDALEHEAPWGMSTNNNHYQIDLNRDGWGLTQRESQALAVQVLKWRPQVFVDHHGQTEQYFFPPPTPPVNPALPASHRRWYERFGRGNARAFDRQGWQYYTRDVFDLHYPGYWDSWPSIHGAVGMTYETDGGGGRGLRWRRDDGSVVTFRDGIAHHYVASLATVRTAVEHGEELLRDFGAFFRTAVERGRGGEPARAYALLPGDDPRRTAALAATLMRHGVEVQRAREAFRAGGRPHAGEEAGPRRFPAGTWLVDMAQPDGRAAATFLRADVPLDSAFLREQFAIWQRNARRGEDAPREGFEFYDLTSWSLPLAFGVETWALDEMPDVRAPAVSVAADRLSGTGDWGEMVPFEVPGLEAGVTSLIPDPPPAVREDAGADGEAGGEPVKAGTGQETPADARARSSYLFRPTSEGSLRLLAGLLREGYRVVVARRPLMAGGEAFPRGTCVVRTGRNPATLHDRIRALARDAGVEVTASHTAFPARGETGPGSSGHMVPLRPPRIAVAAGEGVGTNGYGHTWFVLERRLAYPFTPLPLDRIASGALEPYDVLVLPGGWTGGIRSELGEAGMGRLEGWIERGGVLVGWGGAAAFAVDAELVEADLVRREATGAGATDSLTAEERLDQIDALPGLAEPRPPAVSPTAEPGALQPVPGAVLWTELDLTHWLTLGYGSSDLPVLVDGDDVLTLSPTGSNPVVFPAGLAPGELVVSGFAWPGNTARLLGGAAHAVAERAGDGQVVLFASDPNFRLVWRATTRLFANAVLLGPSLGAEREGY